MARRTQPTSPSSRTRALGYLRVSTAKQVDEGVSLEAQEAKIRSYAATYDIDLIEIIVDGGESAKTLDRPGLQHALSMLRAGKADALIVVKLDRLTRSLADLCTLIKEHFTQAGLLSVNEGFDTRSNTGRLMLNILASVAEWERGAIRDRTSAAMKHKASKGEFCGGDAPYGYRVDVDGVRLVEDAVEQALIAEARKLRAAGFTLRAIAAEFKLAGFVSRKGGAFAAPQIMRMVA